MSDELVQLDYRTMTSKTEWLKQRMTESAQASFVYKLVGGGLFLIALIFMIVVFAQAVSAILGGQAGSAAEYFAISEANKFIFNLALLLIGGAAVPMVALALMQPTHLLLSNSGIRFAARSFLPIKGKQLAWPDVQSIELMRGGSAGSDDSLLITSARGRLSLKLAAISQADRTQLLEGIKRWAPYAVQEPAVLRALTTSRDQTYTELWLDAFTGSPKRDSMSPLHQGALLHGKYTVHSYLGMGGQGTAYLADAEGASKVVLKEFILPVYVDANVRRQALRSFENEARILKTLAHPNIVELKDFFVADQRAYIVLEFVDGPSLKSLVEDKGPLPEKEVLCYAQQLCEALSYLHLQVPPVVHRDVTPDNLILSSKGVLKLVDFNVAQQVTSGTATSVVGKQAYLPPEQFRGEPTTQSDIYAAGGTLFFLLTGKEPEAISVSHPADCNPSVSTALDAVVAKATSLDLKTRYASVELMKNELRI